MFIYQCEPSILLKVFYQHVSIAHFIRRLLIVSYLICFLIYKEITRSFLVNLFASIKIYLLAMILVHLLSALMLALKTKIKK